MSWSAFREGVGCPVAAQAASCLFPAAFSCRPHLLRCKACPGKILDPQERLRKNSGHLQGILLLAGPWDLCAAE